MRPFAPFNARPLKRDTHPKKSVSMMQDEEFEFELTLGVKSKTPRRAGKPEGRKRAPELKILGRKPN